YGGCKILILITPIILTFFWDLLLVVPSIFRGLILDISSIHGFHLSRQVQGSGIFDFLFKL
ncbi:hypothetical protein Pfo_021361, partial [Paulownia fortunei]